MNFKLLPSPSYSSDFDLYSIVQRNGLEPKNVGRRLRFYCPLCDAAGSSRKSGRTGSGALDLENEPWHCFRSSCEASGTARTLAAYFGEVEIEGPKLAPVVRSRPEPQREPSRQLLDMGKAWRELQAAASPESLERVLAWCRVRGWPESVAQAVVLSDEVCFANPKDVEGAGRKLALSAARSGRNLVIPIRDSMGLVRTAVRRWPDGSGSAPKPKSLSLPTKLVGSGEDWGGVWAFGSIPAAMQAAAAGEPIFLVEGAPDYIALVGLLISEDMPGAVLGFYSAQTAHRVVTSLVGKLGDLGMIAPRVVIIPHNDKLSEKEIEKGHTDPIGLRTAKLLADLLRGRAGVFFGTIRSDLGDFADILREDPKKAIALLRVARCIHTKPVPLAEAPEEMKSRFARAIIEVTNRVSTDRLGLLVFHVPPGVGKTYNALRFSADLAVGNFKIPINGRRPKIWPPGKAWPPPERSVVFCCSDHEMADEKIDELSEIAPGTRARHVFGLLKYCEFAEHVEPVFPSVGRRGICGPAKRFGDSRDEQRCEHRDTCPGAEDPKAYRGEVTFSPHALLGSIKADIVIVDENPGVIVTSEASAEEITSLFACRLIPRVLSWRRYRNPAAGDSAALLAQLVQPLATSHAKQVGSGEIDPYSRRIWGEELREVLDSSPDLAKILSIGFGVDAAPPPAPFPAEARSGGHRINHMPDRPAFNALRVLAAYYERLRETEAQKAEKADPLGLAIEPPKPMCAIRLDSDGTWGLEIRKIQKLPKAPVIVLDATGHLTLAEWQAAYPDRNVVIRSLEVQGAAPARALHIDSAAFTRRSIVGGDGSIRPDAAKRIAKVLSLAAREARAVRARFHGDPPTRVGVLTHMPLSKTLKGEGDGAKSAGGLELLAKMAELKQRGFSFEGQTGGSLIGWYGRHDRGTNAYEAVDALIVMGDPWGDIGSLDADAFLLGLSADEIAAGRAAATCQQAIARARHIRRDSGDRVVLVFAGKVPPSIPGVVWQVERLKGGKPADVVSARVTELLWHIAREEGVIGLPVLEAFDRSSTPWADLAPSDVSMKRRRSAFARVAKGLKWRSFSVKTKTGRISLAAPSLVIAEQWAESAGYIERYEREAAPF